MRRYVVVRTDRGRRDFILRELDAGRLRQGWGSRPEHDLRAIRAHARAGQRLTDEERAAWRNRRLLDAEPDGLRPGDVVVVPNLPEQGRWVIARVAGAYKFEPVAPVAGAPADYGHVVPVAPVRRADGKVAVFDPDNAHVDARLRATMRNLSRMWSIDALGAAVEKLVAAAEGGVDTAAIQPAAEKLDSIFTAMRAAAWREVQARYHGAQFEQLVQRLFERIYDQGRVEHWGGAGEHGADLIVFTQDPLGLEFKIAVQVKLHDGTDDDTHALEQIKGARAHHRVDAGVVVTTATETSARFEERRAALESELGIDIRVITRDGFTEMVMAHLGRAATV